MDPRGEHRWLEDLPAYALGALDPGEARDLEAHLAECEHCRERLRWLEPAVDILPASVQQLQPPPELKVALMEKVREDVAAPAEQHRPWWRGGRAGFSLRPALALGALALVTAGAIGYGLNSGEEGSQTTTTPIRVEAVPSENVRAAAVLEGEGEGAVLRVARLPAIEEDEVYQLWVQMDGDYLPSATFELSGDRTAAPEIAKLPDGADAVLVTREPDGGSEQPSTAPLLTARLGS